MKKSHIENTVGPWTRQKLDGLEEYLNAYTIALKKQRFQLVFIDAFAGAGRSRIRDAWDGADEEDMRLFDDEFVTAEEQFIEGSPRRALGLQQPFDKHFFFDADAGRVQLLNDLKTEYPERQINIQAGDANRLIQDLAPSLDQRMVRGVAFLDPYGPHIDWRTIEVLGRTRKFEVLINFPLGMAINRLITRNGKIPEGWRQGLNACFGNNDWERLVYREQADLFGETGKKKVDDAANQLLYHYLGATEKDLRACRNTERCS